MHIADLPVRVRRLEKRGGGGEAGCCSGRPATPTRGGGRATSAPGSPNGSTATSKVRSPSSLRQPIYAPRSQCLLGTSLIIFRGQKFACCPALGSFLCHRAALAAAAFRRTGRGHPARQAHFYSSSSSPHDGDALSRGSPHHPRGRGARGAPSLARLHGRRGR